MNYSLVLKMYITWISFELMQIHGFFSPINLLEMRANNPAMGHVMEASLIQSNKENQIKSTK